MFSVPQFPAEHTEISALPLPPGMLRAGTEKKQKLTLRHQMTKNNNLFKNFFFLRFDSISKPFVITSTRGDVL